MQGSTVVLASGGVETAALLACEPLSVLLCRARCKQACILSLKATGALCLSSTHTLARSPPAPCAPSPSSTDYAHWDHAQQLLPLFVDYGQKNSAQEERATQARRTAHKLPPLP